jgi:AraC-like DNA-binding protein
VEQKFITHKKVTEYADHLAVTPNYLNEIVKRASGFPASHHIQQRIVLEAKRHATYSDSSMKEIAYHLGFDDIAHFSKFFKNVVGQSFTDFKKQSSCRFGQA